MDNNSIFYHFQNMSQKACAHLNFCMYQYLSAVSSIPPVDTQSFPCVCPVRYENKHFVTVFALLQEHFAATSSAKETEEVIGEETLDICATVQIGACVAAFLYFHFLLTLSTVVWRVPHTCTQPLPVRVKQIL